MSPGLRRWATLLSAVVSAPARAVDIPVADHQQVPLAVGSAKLGEAMSLAVLPNRNVVHTARDGWVRVTTPAGITKNAGKLNVYTRDEEDLQGVAADPDFAVNRWIHLFYSPRLEAYRPQPAVRRAAFLRQHRRPARHGAAHHAAGRRDVHEPQREHVRPGTPGTRPEIYAMGFRNPFRMSVDKTNTAPEPT
ncbi:PQQ-dependent sugar dehydrogenase [Herbidospora galbida]|uniref:PQQ-dependent sugar dehydrogenase n=1 Tax=Herbidospora galbida TaxID=2575442 RepID=UPI001FE5E4A7|nr:PQQ-dependent sugar dehydrogenase [Herbidospora galbida]